MCRRNCADSEEAAGDLARENKPQVELLDQRDDEMGRLMDGAAALQGRIDQLERDLAAAREEAARQRVEAERAHTDLAKVEMRLEAMPRLEADLATARAKRETEQRARIAAEQSAAVGPPSATASRSGWRKTRRASMRSTSS